MNPLSTSAQGCLQWMNNAAVLQCWKESAMMASLTIIDGTVVLVLADFEAELSVWRKLVYAIHEYLIKMLPNKSCWKCLEVRNELIEGHWKIAEVWVARSCWINPILLPWSNKKSSAGLSQSSPLNLLLLWPIPKFTSSSVRLNDA